MKDRDNIYQAARMAASRRDRLFANRDRAAEQLHVSSQALYDYENGNTLPPCDVVQWMIEVYQLPALKAQHMRACCPLMTEGVPESVELTRAALGWAVYMDRLEQVGRSFAALAIDSRITRDEIVVARTIRQKAVELTRVMQETIAAIDTALQEYGGKHEIHDTSRRGGGAE